MESLTFTVRRPRRAPATFAAPDLTLFCRLDELGLEAAGQRLDPDCAVLECRVPERDPWCRKCGAEGVPRDTVARRLAHDPFGHRPTTRLGGDPWFAPASPAVPDNDRVETLNCALSAGVEPVEVQLPVGRTAHAT